MKLESLTLKDFRLHKKFHINFDENITTIVGKSYSGKSTVIRALKWICLNKPSGLSVIRWGAKETKAVLIVDGHKIVRIRSKSRNLYKLDNEVFEAFGNNVPDKIAKLLNISEINFQGQHSLPFWFGESDGEVSRRLNSIVNLSVIDSTLSNLSSALHKSRSAVDIGKERLQEIKQRREDLSYVEEMTEEWSKIQRLRNLNTNLECTVFELEDTVETCIRYQTIIEKTRPPSLDSVTEIWETLSDVEDNISVLSGRLNKIISTKQKVDDTRNAFDKLVVELHKLEKGRCPLCGRK